MIHDLIVCFRQAGYAMGREGYCCEDCPLDNDDLVGRMRRAWCEGIIKAATDRARAVARLEVGGADGHA